MSISVSRLIASLTLLLTVAVFGQWSLHGEDDHYAWLSWRNGDELKGRILQSEEEKIRWSSFAFASPLSVSVNQLKGVRFSSTKVESSQNDENFRIILNNGDRLHGNLLAIDENTITISCGSFTEPLQINKPSIRRIIHIRSNHLRFSGPGELDGWTSNGRDRKPTDWFTDLRGEFATHQWSGNLFREIEFPESVEVEFRARFPLGNPSLEVGFLREPGHGPMLETWDDHLVLTFGTQFVPVMQLTSDTRKLEFRVFWNQLTGEVQVCSLSGKQLASLSGPSVDRISGSEKHSRSNAPLQRGFSILSRTPELKLSSLTVREWNGKAVPEVDLSQPRLSLHDRPARFRIDDVFLEPGSAKLRIGNSSVPLNQLEEMVVSPDREIDIETAQANSTRIAWHNGSSVGGKFVRLDNSRLTVQPEWSSAEVAATLSNAKEIRFPEEAEPIETSSDQLSSNGLFLHGTVRILQSTQTDRDAPSIIGWQAAGADQAVPLAEDLKATIVRDSFPSSSPEALATVGQARLYLTNDEILVGTLKAADNESVQFRSRITGPLTIPAEQIRAIDIGNAGRVLEGFGDTEWEATEEVEGEVIVENETVLLKGGSYGNPSILIGDRVHFDLEWKQSYGAITLRLFASGPDPNTPSTDIIVAAQGNRLFIGKLKDNGAFSFSGDQIPLSGSKASFEVIALHDKLEIVVNNKSTLSIPIEKDRVSGNGIYFKMGGGWQGWNQVDNQVEITNFLIECSPGSLPPHIIASDARERLLKIPRSLRENIPTHLLIAPNGDLLRGKLVSVNGNSIQFDSGEESLKLPLNRVSAIVWLREEPTPPEEKEKTGDTLFNPFEDPYYQEIQKFNFKVTHQLVLSDGSRLRLAADQAQDNQLIGESSVLGTCRVSLENVQKIDRSPATPIHKLGKMDVVAFEGWHISFTPEPDIPEEGEPQTSPLIGKAAPDFKLTMMDDSTFELSEQKGKVVVLDFWATWCGPCIKAMPDVQAAVEAFPPELVSFCAINQAETTPIVTGFLEKREWDHLPVALDFNMKTSRDYEVDAIPHTVVIDTAGKVSWIHTGYDENLKRKLFDAIRKAASP